MNIPMNSKNSAKVLSALVLSVVFISCSKKPAEGTYQLRPNVPSTFTGLDGDPNNGDQSVETGDTPLSACEYWDSLTPQTKVFQKTAQNTPEYNFQFLRTFTINPSGIRGSFHIASLPQAQYALSFEYNNGASPLPDVWTFENFYIYATVKISFAKAALEKRLSETTDEEEKKQIRKQIDELEDKQTKLNIAKHMPWFMGARKKALVGRNENLMAALEEQIPGAFSGSSGDLTKSKLFLGLLLAMGDPTRPDIALLQASKDKLTKRVNLFVSQDWGQRRLDLQKALSSLRYAADPAPNAQERLCKYLVAQRLMAQVLRLKGMKSAPRLSPVGHLAPLPTEWDRSYEFSDVASSVYRGAVVDEKWILAQMLLSGPDMPRMTGTQNTEQFIEATRFWATLASHRSVNTWQSGKDPLPTRLNVSPALLKLGFGLLGIHLTILKTTEFSVNPPEQRGPEHGYLKLTKEDTADNLARLILLTREMVRGMWGLRVDPEDFGHKVLSEAQVLRFTAPTEGVIDQFLQLRTAASLEGMIRMRSGRGSDTLGDVLEKLRRP